MEEKELHILWTNADPTTGKLMVMMYAKNSLKKHWWDKVIVILWGATAGLAATNAEIQSEIREAKQCGVKFCGCVACAIELGVVDALQKQGIELKPWGPPLTELIQSGAHILTV